MEKEKVITLMSKLSFADELEKFTESMVQLLGSNILDQIDLDMDLPALKELAGFQTNDEEVEV